MANDIRPLDERVHKQITLLREVDADTNLTDTERKERKDAIYAEYDKARNERDKAYKENELDSRRDEVQRQQQQQQVVNRKAEPKFAERAYNPTFAAERTSGLTINANPAQVEVLRQFALGNTVNGHTYRERSYIEIPHESPVWHMRNARDRKMHMEIAEEIKRERAKEYHKQILSERDLSSAQFSIMNPAPYTHIGADFNTDLLASMVRYNSVLEVADIRTKASGEPVLLPNVDDAGNEGVLLAEGADMSQNVDDPPFGHTRIDIFKYSSRIVKVSLEALNDVRYDLGAELAEMLGIRVGRIVGKHMTVGAGGTPQTEPHGLFTAAPTITQTATRDGIIYSEILDLFNDLEIAYRPGAKFSFQKSFERQLMAITSNQGVPIFVPGFLSQGRPDTLLGHEYVLNDLAPATGTAGNKIAVFGQLGLYTVVTVPVTYLAILRERFAETGEVGFVAIQRWGGNLRQPNATVGRSPVVAIESA